QDHDLPDPSRGELRRSRRAPCGDPDHGAARARPLLRARRGSHRRARLRVTFETAVGGGMRGLDDAFSDDVTTKQIHEEIEQLSEPRQDLGHRLSDGLDSSVKDEIKALDERLQELWQTLRLEKARLRFGERDEIVRRARAEERLERAA